MSTPERIITIAVVVLGTMATRFLPFFLFPEHRTPPKAIQYLGTVLPLATMGLLVVYCLKDAAKSVHHGLPEVIALLFLVLLHRRYKNTILTVVSSTILYMVLVQVVFP